MQRTPCAQVPARPLVLWLLLAALWAGPSVAAATASAEQASVQVQEGDMASVLAFRHKPRGSAIEQMMLALLRLNPEAFIQGNVNLLREGAVLRLPSAEEVLRTPAEQARQAVQGQHQNALQRLESSVTGGLASASLQAPSTAAASEAPAHSRAESEIEREALIERLRAARAQLQELEQNIQALERLTLQTAVPVTGAAASAPAQADPVLPLSWIWLGVAAIIAVMIGVGASRRPRHSAASGDAAQTGAAIQFQSRLAAMDLNLDAPPRADPLPGRPT